MPKKHTAAQEKNEQAWAADSVERRSIDTLIPYARNARTHSEAQVAQIAASMKEWGWTIPVLVGEDGGIIAGHGRVLAARQLGLDNVPCMTARGWSEAQKRAYVLADNKLALNAEWDQELLRIDLQDLQEMDFDVGLIGFSKDELGLILEGWHSDIVPHDKDDIDGDVAALLRITVDKDEEDIARESVTKALDAAGVTYELT